MFKIIFSFIFISLSTLSLAQNASPEKGWSVFKSEQRDINFDGKKDDVIWLSKSSKSARPERLIINVDGKRVLDHRDSFCGPSGQNGYGNAELCNSLIVVERPQQKELNLVDSEKSSKDESREQGHIYEFRNGKFFLKRSYFISSKTGSMQETEKEHIQIDYTTGASTRSTWSEFGVDSKVKNRTQINCELKNPRKDEEMIKFNGFSVRDEVKCKE